MATATVAIGRQLKSVYCVCLHSKGVGRGGQGTESWLKRGGEGQGRTPAEELWKAAKSQQREAADSHMARRPPASHQSPSPSVSDILGRGGEALTLSTVELRLLVSKAQSKRAAACCCYTLKLDALCCRLSLWLDSEDYKSCQGPRVFKARTINLDFECPSHKSLVSKTWSDRPRLSRHRAVVLLI